MNILGHVGRLGPGVAKKHLIHNRLAYAEYTATHGGDGRNRNINIDSENHGTACEDTEKRAESQVNSAGYYIENLRMRNIMCTWGWHRKSAEIMRMLLPHTSLEFPQELST